MSDLPRSADPAEIYDECFVPALFRPWAAMLCDVARLRRGDRVLDVACGTGALSGVAAERVSPGGSVVGLDANPSMLAVARRKHADIDWREGRAEALPFDDASFDAAVSQFGLMFFDDPIAALREMRRVLRPSGRLVVAVCDAVERSPGYAALAALLERLFGRDIADAFRAPFALGDANRLLDLCGDAGLDDAQVARRDGTVRFASIDALVSTERACVWTLGGLLDDAQFERLRGEAHRALAPFVDRERAAVFSMPALVIAAGGGVDNDGNRNIVERIYADFAAGDIDGVLGVLAPDVEWTEAQGSPYAGTYHGAPQVLEAVFARLHADWTGFAVAPAEFVCGDASVVAIGRYRAEARGGNAFDAPFLHVWSIAGGRVTRFQQFTDTAAMQAALR